MKTLFLNTYIIKSFCVMAFFLCIFSTTNAQVRVTVDYQNNSGTYTIPVSNGFLTNFTAELWGGGGGGGGAESVYGATAAGGGGGGAYANVSNFNPSEDLTLVVAYGGNGGYGNVGGSGGGESKVQFGTDFVQANGGGGGISAWRNGGGLTASDGGSKGTVEGTLSYTPTLGSDGSKGGGSITAPSAGKGGNGGNGGTGGNGGSGSGSEVSSNGSAGNPLSGGGGGAAAYDLFTTNASHQATGGTGAKGNVKISFDFVIPDISIDKSNISFCQGGSDIISINSSVCNGTTFQWYKNGSPMQEQTNASLTVADAGTYYVIATLTYTEEDFKTELALPAFTTISVSNGTEISSSKQSGDVVVTVNQPTTSFLYETICAGEVYTLNDVEYFETDTYIQTTKNAAGCDSIITLYLTVNQPTTSFLYDTICAGEIYTLNTFEYSITDTYIQTIENALGCDSIITLYLTIIDDVEEIQNLAVDTLGTTAILSWDDAENAEEYLVEWFVKDSEEILGSEYITETFYEIQDLDFYQDSYTFSVQAINRCFQSEKQTVNIEQIPTEITKINNFTDIIIYPNPVKDELKITNYELRDGEMITISDLNGRVVSNYELKITNCESNINVSHLPEGVYLLHIGNQTMKIIKR